MTKQEKICELYYIEHNKQQEIANIVGVSQAYVAKVVKADSRYYNEKEQRKAKQAQMKQAKQTQKAKIRKEKREQANREYEYLIYLQRCNSREMSRAYLTNSLNSWEYKALYGSSSNV